MEAIQSRAMNTFAETQAASRSRIYSFIAECFRYPDGQFRAQAQNGDIQSAFGQLFSALPYAFDWTEKEQIGHEGIAAAADEAIEVEFIRLFEAGPGNPPCPLQEGLYREDRKTVFKELVLFYNHFGLSYEAGSQADRPDHVCYEMEFLHYLTFKELLAIQNGKESLPYMRAQRDFLDRHPGRWLPDLVRKMDKIGNHPPETHDAAMEVFWFYAGLAGMVARFAAAESGYLNRLLNK